VRNGTDEIFTTRLHAARVNMENAASFLGHHVSATFELRAGVVKARRPAQRVGAQRRALTPPRTARRLQCDGRTSAITVAECLSKLQCDPRDICNVYAHGNGAQIASTFG